jgi:hypothetical protein
MASRRRPPAQPAKKKRVEIADPWQRMCRALQAYKTFYGDTRVPARWRMNPDLARWVQEQLERAEQMPDDQVKQLEKLGFWGDHEEQAVSRRPRRAKRTPALAPAPAPAAEEPAPVALPEDRQTSTPAEPAPEPVEAAPEPKQDEPAQPGKPEEAVTPAGPAPAEPVVGDTSGPEQP